MSKRGDYKTISDFLYATTPKIKVIPLEQFEKTIGSKIPQNSLENQIQDTLTIASFPKKYSSTSEPDVFGPPFWFTIHNGAAGYPIDASPIVRERMKGYILGLPFMIRCGNCKEHATAHIEANRDRLDDICKGRESLFNFFVDFHNYVNKRYGKREMGYDEALKLYNMPVNGKMIYM